MMTKYQITARKQGPKWLATVSRLAGSDQREGDWYQVIAVALGDTEEDAIYDAVNETFFQR
jgi:hypothetical protein